ncbi:EF-P 5-aminopentanol modification-associated protein YfmH [Alkalicoccobacillus porphyridii]|uniref:Insulinase family protein n=1 Tax=Alkalicoccobacillus porphyridii TaxID=2597270 RepID=A0A553ZYH9_9BACI|nr:pitrilysin family protein [Alkalicoccobacillus porphyridii]TSB46465.1 insulinase family protein [Alkalicoccobacillus porphyridii]
MNQMPFKQLQETLYHETLDNGLQVYVLPKEGFNKTFATITTKYGSIDNRFTPIDGESELQVPDGIAHFLEHKMFEDEHGDVFHDFSKQGASANAFTSFTSTAYLFSSTANVAKNLDTLVNFVQHPYFTPDSVEKEKGIINQEITMYDDNPDWRLYFGTIENMFEHHPVKIDIAGTIESISHITDELLYTCYHTFYHPSNLLLFVVGPVDPKEVMKQIKENQAGKSFAPPQDIKRFFDEEPDQVAKDKTVIQMPVQSPKCLVGIKETGAERQGSDLLKRELAIKVLLDLMFGQSSENYQTLYQSGLIDDTFSYEYTAERGFGFTIIGGDSPDPDVFAQKIKEMVQDFASSEINEANMERAIKKKIGSFLRSLNSPEFIATQFTRYQFNEMNLFDVVPTLEAMTKEDLQFILQDHFQLQRSTVCQVRAHT